MRLFSWHQLRYGGQGVPDGMSPIQKFAFGRKVASPATVQLHFDGKPVTRPGAENTDRLNSSMSALACYRQLRIDSGLSVTRDINPAAQKLRIRVSLVDELTHYL